MPRGLTPGLALMTTTWQPRCVPSSRSPWRSVGGEDRPPLIEASGTPCGAPTSSSPTLLSLSYQSGPGGRCRDNPRVVPAAATRPHCAVSKQRSCFERRRKPSSTGIAQAAGTPSRQPTSQRFLVEGHFRDWPRSLPNSDDPTLLGLNRLQD